MEEERTLSIVHITLIAVSTCLGLLFIAFIIYFLVKNKRRMDKEFENVNFNNASAEIPPDSSSTNNTLYRIESENIFKQNDPHLKITLENNLVTIYYNLVESSIEVMAKNNGGKEWKNNHILQGSGVVKFEISDVKYDFRAFLDNFPQKDRSKLNGVSCMKLQISDHHLKLEQELLMTYLHLMNCDCDAVPAYDGFMCRNMNFKRSRKVLMTVRVSQQKLTEHLRTPSAANDLLLQTVILADRRAYKLLDVPIHMSDSLLGALFECQIFVVLNEFALTFYNISQIDLNLRACGDRSSDFQNYKLRNQTVSPALMYKQSVFVVTNLKNDVTYLFFHVDGEGNITFPPLSQDYLMSRRSNLMIASVRDGKHFLNYNSWLHDTSKVKFRASTAEAIIFRMACLERIAASSSLSSSSCITCSTDIETASVTPSSASATSSDSISHLDVYAEREVGQGDCVTVSLPKFEKHKLSS